MDPHGSPWIPMDPDGSSCILMDPHGSSWIPMDPRGSGIQIIFIHEGHIDILGRMGIPFKHTRIHRDPNG